LKQDSKFTFKGFEDRDKHNCAVCESAGDISLKPEGGVASENLTIESGKTAGRFWFDPAMGMVIATEETQDIAFKASNAGQSMTSRTKTRSESKLVGVTDLSK